MPTAGAPRNPSPSDPMKRTKYDRALSEQPSKIIVVHCETCDMDYDIREVTNEVQHPHAAHVIAFDCPRGHHCESRRVWKDGCCRSVGQRPHWKN